MIQTNPQSRVLRLWYKPGRSMQGIILSPDGQRRAFVLSESLYCPAESPLHNLTERPIL